MKKTSAKRSRDETDDNSIVKLIQETVRAEMKTAMARIDHKFQQQKANIDEQFQNHLAVMNERYLEPMEERIDHRFRINYSELTDVLMKSMENQLLNLEDWFDEQNNAILSFMQSNNAPSSIPVIPSNIIDSEDLVRTTDNAGNTAVLVEKFGEIEKKKKDSNPRLTVSKTFTSMLRKI